MNKYNPNIHHRKSIRLKGYDYSQAGLYFITICCDARKHHFGEITDGKMILNEYGTIAFNEWMKTPELRKNIELGEFIVMPNHIHGIIIITRMCELHSPQRTGDFKSPQQTIGAIIRGYKSSVTKQINLLGDFNSHQPLWQRNYHEHIIRNKQSYQTISDYIINNRAHWENDKFYMP